MAAFVKSFLVIVAFMFCLQLVEMARIPRDAPAGPDMNLENIDIRQLANTLVEKLKGFIDDETVQKLMSSASTAIQETSKAVSETVSNALENIKKQ